MRSTRASGIAMRPVLLVVTVLGGVVVMLTGGVLAAFTDTALTGVNRVESGARERPAVLQLADYGEGCGEFSDDLTTGLVGASGLQPGEVAGVAFCLRNAGTAPLQVTVRSIEVAGGEAGCTGVEAEVDTSCGEGIGELGTVLYLDRFEFDCLGKETLAFTRDEFHGSLKELPLHFGSSAVTSLSPGQVVCLSYRVFFRDVVNGVTEEAIQRAQSDFVEWRFRFTGTSP